MTGYTEPLMMVLLSTLVFFLPTFICGPSPQYSGQLGDAPIDQGMLDVSNVLCVMLLIYHT